MNARQVMRVIVSLTAGAMPVLLWAHSGGPDPRNTGAPGDNQLACASAGCHTSSFSGGPINAGGGSVSISFSTPTYTPGTPVGVTVQVTDPTNRRYGFQASARLESNLATAQAGRFSTGTGMVILCDNGFPRGNGNCPSSALVEFIEQSTPSTTGTWTFNWTPPAAGSGPVRFYVAGNAVNGNGTNDGGDRVYTASATLPQAADCSDPAPSITNAISAGAYGARTDFGPGSWIEIFGTNFAAARNDWESSFTGTAAPTSVGGISVQIGGKPAFVWFVNPTQLNVQAPDNTGSGPVAITVTRNINGCSKTSAPFSMQQVTAAPGLLAPPQDPFLSAGKQWLAALAQDGSFVGLPSKPVKPGDTIVTYGVGFGPTNPTVAAGQKTPGATRIASPLVISLGGVQLTDAQIAYAGLVPPYVGLYQFNLVVPNVPDGDQPLVVRLGGVTLPQSLLLSVKR